MDALITLLKAVLADRASVIELLQSLGLPTEDLPQSLDHFIIAQERGKVVGSVGLEIYGKYALLRSLAVDSSMQGNGLGKLLYKEALSLARANSVSDLYLITTTAAIFFERQGFQRVDRAKVPAAISQTAQFHSLCPSSATVMHHMIT